MSSRSRAKCGSAGGTGNIIFSLLIASSAWFYVLSSTLHRLPPLRFRWVGGGLDWNPGLLQRLNWQVRRFNHSASSISTSFTYSTPSSPRSCFLFTCLMTTSTLVSTQSTYLMLSITASQARRMHVSHHVTPNSFLDFTLFYTRGLGIVVLHVMVPEPNRIPLCFLK